MIYRVEISTEALDMLMKHVAFLAQVSRDAAEKLRDEFKSQLQSLSQMPHRCPWIEGGMQSFIRWMRKLQLCMLTM
mgnify:CR=1 FL=1